MIDKPGKPEEGERPAAEIPPDWLDEFESAARRPLRDRFRYAFIRTYKPVLCRAVRVALGLVSRTARPGAVRQVK
jgi:hypothetical protein